jgi:hypothetical protein
MKVAVPKERIPLWATKEFRLIITVGVMAASVLAVLVFEIGPMLNARAVKRAAKALSGPNVFQPANPNDPNPPPKEVRFDGFLDRVRDSTPISELDEPYYMLVRYLSKVDPDALSKQGKIVSYPLFAKVPGELRGVTVKVEAMFAYTSGPQRFNDKRSGDAGFYSRVYLTDLSGTEGYVLDVLGPLPPLKLHSLVACDAVFYKVATYEGDHGPVQAPLLLGRNLRIVTERVAPDLMGTGSLIVGVALAVAVVVMYMTIRIVTKSRSERRVEAPVPKAG